MSKLIVVEMKWDFQKQGQFPQSSPSYIVYIYVFIVFIFMFLLFSKLSVAKIVVVIKLSA